ncbi:MAG: endonuclease [Myxococcaceae bacterium]|nr:endonuclease [Myxococcaceae bacterium]
MAYVKKEETSRPGKDEGISQTFGGEVQRGDGHGERLERATFTPKSRPEPRAGDTWFQRVHDQIEQAERRYRGRSRERGDLMHKLDDEGMTPLEVDSPKRVQARLRRLGIEGAEGRLVADTARVLTRIVPSTAEPAKLVYERVLGRSDLTSVCFLERGLKVSRTVGRVRIGDSRGRLAGYGTGFLVSPRLMLTNNHVLRSAVEASHSQIEFNYQSGLDGAALPSVIFTLDPASFFVTDKALDYTLVAVKQESVNGMPLSEFGFNRLIEAEGKVLLGEYVNIIQHPNGEPKQIAIRENQIVDLLDNFCHYETDTAPGSSGSPVYNDQWEVVALHHMGVPKRTPEGQLLTVEGEIWEAGMDPALLAWKANEGTRVSSLVRHLRAQSLSSDAARLLADLIGSMARTAGKARPRTVSQRLPAQRTGAKTRGNGRKELAGRGEDGAVADGAVGAGREQEPDEVEVEAGGATVTVPLRLSIQVGLADGGAPQQLTVVQPRLITPSRKIQARRQRPEQGAQAQPELEEALAELERARRRPYFDEAAARRAQELYYAELGEELDFALLSELVRGTHHTRPRYAPMRQVYPWVDLHPDGLLRSIYSSKEFDPEDFIREDARIDQLRGERFRELLAIESSLGAEAMAAEMDLLEAALPFNCEHVVPQSWFGKREPMRGDLHHLFACESNCNSFRGNTPYFDFPDFEEAVREECGKRVANKFEPTSGKGAVARATFYFLLRYPGEINRTSTEYEESRLAVLMNWHQENPPSLYEQHRNEAIFESQGNRNPFIDHPEWAELVDFHEGLG